MKSIAFNLAWAIAYVLIASMILCSLPLNAGAEYIPPPDIGGPDTSDGSGTR